MKNKFIIFFLLISLPIMVKAKATASISASSSVEVGSKVTLSVTLKNTAAWNIKIISSGSTSGCSQNFADATSNAKNTTKTLSVTCKATGVGAIAFSVTGDISSEDGEKTNVSLSKRVTVTEPRVKSTDATLSSLTIEGYELDPTFQSDVLNYNINLPSTVNKIKISAKVHESHASVDGTGEFEVTEGNNIFNIVVTAENGTTKTYVINVNVEDIDPIEIKIEGKKYTVVKNGKNLEKPELYDEKTIMINNFDIPAFYSEITNFTLIGIKDESGIISFAIYDEQKDSYQLYNELTANTLALYLVDIDKEIDGFVKEKIKIKDLDVLVLKSNVQSRFVICYAMDLTTGKYDYYSYDTKDNTFQIYNEEEILKLKDDIKVYTYISLVFGVGLVISFIAIICLLKGSSKKKIKVEKSKEEVKKDKKNNEKKFEEIKKEPQEEPKKSEEVNDDTEMYDILETLKKKKKKEKDKK